MHKIRTTLCLICPEVIHARQKRVVHRRIILVAEQPWESIMPDLSEQEKLWIALFQFQTQMF